MPHHSPATNQASSQSADTFRHDVKTILTTMRLQAQLMLRLLRHQRTPDRERLLTGLTSIDAGISRLAERIDRERL